MLASHAVRRANTEKLTYVYDQTCVYDQNQQLLAQQIAAPAIMLQA